MGEGGWARQLPREPQSLQTAARERQPCAFAMTMVSGSYRISRAEPQSLFMII